MNDFGSLSLSCAQPLSSLSHLAGAVFFTWQAFRVLRQEVPASLRFISFAVFAGACIFLLLMSGIYHWLSAEGIAHIVFQRLDHAGIFLVIAGSFTPIHCTLFKGVMRWGVLGVVWSLSVIGIVLKLVYFSDIPEGLGLMYYMGLGWLGALTGFKLWQAYSLHFIAPLLLGGVFYTLGALIEYQNTLVLVPGIVGPHEILHFGVLFGIGLQWAFIVRALRTAAQPLQR